VYSWIYSPTVETLENLTFSAMVDESPKFSHLRLEEFESFTIVWMIRNPVNTMNVVMWDELNRALQYVEADASKKGIAFMSGVPKDVFTAGNDIMELYAPNTSKSRYRSFWLLSNTFLGNLYLSRLVTVAGIRGACPAGGCCLSLCCDYRIMTENGYIGLNEVALGISVPKFWGQLMEKTIGSGKAQKILQFATLLKSKDAYEAGLVDFLCSKSDLKQRVMDTLEKLVTLPEKGRSVRALSCCIFCNNYDIVLSLSCLTNVFRKLNSFYAKNLLIIGWAIWNLRQKMHGIC
jgi:Delta3-Delta2-enoyl-CoA isomerase